MITITVAGDFSQKYRVGNTIIDKEFGILFDDIRPIIKHSDYSIVNFEFPIVNNPRGEKSIKKTGTILKGTKESIEALSYAGFKCCTLANNHILDWGIQCCIDTKETLEKAGISTVGAGINTESASSILYKKIKGETLAIINCAENEFTIATDISAGANPLNPIKQYYKIQEARKTADYLIVIVHGGHEHYQLPSMRMQETYRFFIDAGADAVVNHHQHCYSGYEIYKNKPIFYGLGNLLFDHQTKRDDIWNKGFMVTLSFDKENFPKFDLHPYSQCDKKGLGIHLLNDKSAFYNKITQLNTIIADKNKLSSALNNYYKSSSSFVLSWFEPYFGHPHLVKLLSILKIKTLISEKQALAILNSISCESHRDKILFALREKLNLNHA